MSDKDLDVGDGRQVARQPTGEQREAASDHFRKADIWTSSDMANSTPSASSPSSEPTPRPTGEGSSDSD